MDGNIWSVHVIQEEFKLPLCFFAEGYDRTKAHLQLRSSLKSVSITSKNCILT